MSPITSARRSHLVGGCAVEDIQIRQSGSEVHCPAPLCPLTVGFHLMPDAACAERRSGVEPGHRSGMVWAWAYPPWLNR
jgi:hypothetical protein